MEFSFLKSYEPNDKCFEDTKLESHERNIESRIGKLFGNVKRLKLIVT